MVKIDLARFGRSTIGAKVQSLAITSRAVPYRTDKHGVLGVIIVWKVWSNVCIFGVGTDDRGFGVEGVAVV